MPLDEQTAAILKKAAAAGLPSLEDQSPDAAREQMAALSMAIRRDDVESVSERTVPGPDGDIPVRIYHPSPGDILPVVAFFHGGGWVIGDLETHDGLCRALANRSRSCVVAVHYRLAPEHAYPAAADDCYAVTEWLSASAAEIGGDGTRLAVCGDSAGGNLAAVVALMARDRDGPSLRAQALVYPVTDYNFETSSYRKNATGYGLTRSAMRWFWNHYVSDADRAREPYASPLRAETHARLPTAFVSTAEYDPLRDEGQAYARRLEAAGVPVELAQYDGMAHGFLRQLGILERADVAMQRLAAWLTWCLREE